MRGHLIQEESSEILLALHNQDEAKFVDGLGDLMYVTAGSWVSIWGVRIGAMTLMGPVTPRDFHQLVHNMLGLNAELMGALNNAYIRQWEEKAVRRVIQISVEMCAHAGYDALEVFDAIADSNDTKWYKEENGQRVKDKGPDFRVPVLAHLLKGGKTWKSSSGR